MRELKAMAYLPMASINGKILNRAGYDECTGVYLALEGLDLPDVADEPSKAQIVGAIKTIWKPWSGYSFATPHDRAAMFAAILTAVCRPALHTAPGFIFDAPVQGSGKTKAASALGALMRGERVGVSPYVDGAGGEAETVKKLVSLAMSGAGFWLIDNVVGTWRSPALAAAITEGQIDERVLGGNQWYRGVNRMLVVASSNNASLDRDLGRRFIRVRIDAGVECPQARSFSFDPVDMALTMRLAIAHNVLVLVRAYQLAGSPVAGRGDAGFSEWNRLVRSVVLWVQDAGFVDDANLDQFGDPAHSILEAAGADDPDGEALRMLLLGLQIVFGDEPFIAREVQIIYADENLGSEGPALIREGLGGLVGNRREVSVLSIGRALKFRRDRIAGGLVLKFGGENRSAVGVWMVRNG